MGQREKTNELDWEMAGAYLYELGLIPDFELKPGNVETHIDRNAACAAVLTDGEKTVSHNTNGKEKISSQKIFNKVIEIIS